MVKLKESSNLFNQLQYNISLWCTAPVLSSELSVGTCEYIIIPSYECAEKMPNPLLPVSQVVQPGLHEVNILVAPVAVLVQPLGQAPHGGVNS